MFFVYGTSDLAKYRPNFTLTELYGWMERINPEPAGGFGTDEP